MKIVLSEEITKEKLSEIDDFLSDTKIGEEWASKLYGYIGNEDYSRPYFERALADIDALKFNCDTNNWWQCAIESIEYFRETFDISWPIEFFRNKTKNSIKNLMYSCAYNDAGEIFMSEISISDLSEFPDEVPPANMLVGGIGHEAWHAKQHEEGFKFFQSIDGILDLEKINPSNPENRGAIYLLSNYLYELPHANREACYRFQILEAEALHLQKSIVTLLS